MSHFSKVATKIKDLDALCRALDRAKIRYRRDAAVRGFAGQTLRADVSVDFGKYDLGVVRAGDACEVVADWWGIETTTGKTEAEVTGQLSRDYAVEVARTACEAEGYEIEDFNVQKDGSVQMVAVAWN